MSTFFQNRRPSMESKKATLHLQHVQRNISLTIGHSKPLFDTQIRVYCAQTHVFDVQVWILDITEEHKVDDRPFKARENQNSRAMRASRYERNVVHRGMNATLVGACERSPSSFEWPMTNLMILLRFE